MLSRLPRYGLIALLAASLACGLYAVYVAVVRTGISHSLDYEEGNVLNAAVRITHGLTPYPDPQSWPAVLNPYGPVAYSLTAVPVWIFGPSFQPARLIVVLSTMVCAGLLALIIYQEARSWLLAVAFGLLFLSHAVVQFWMPILRVDLIGLALELAGLYLFLRFPQRWWLAILFFAAAIFTKPTFVAAPIACLVFMLVRRQYRRAMEFVVTGLVLCAALLVVLQVTTRGAFAFDVLRSHPDPLVTAHLKTFLRYLVFSNPLLVICAIAGVILVCAKRDFNLPAIYSVLAVILVTVTMLKLGSNDNHLLEMVAAVIILAALAISRLARELKASQAIAGIATALLAVFSLLQLPYHPVAEPIQACQSAYSYLRTQSSDRILSEDVGALVSGDKTVWVSNPFVYAQLARVGRLSDAPLRERIQGHWFDMIILEKDASRASERWSPEVLEAIRGNYRLLAEASCPTCRFVYVPKQKSKQ